MIFTAISGCTISAQPQVEAFLEFIKKCYILLKIAENIKIEKDYIVEVKGRNRFMG